MDSDRDTIVALLIERAKLAGTWSSDVTFMSHIVEESEKLGVDKIQSLRETNRRWRVEVYEARGLPHDHVPITSED